MEELQQQVNRYKEETGTVGALSDGYHTFNELYEHRCVLTAALFRQIPYTWKAKVHDDGTMYEDMFITGACTPDGMATYHYDLECWDMFKIPEIEHAPKFDGHTPQEALNRIEKYYTRGIQVFSEDEMTRLMDCVCEVLTCIPPEKQNAYLQTFLKTK